MVALLDRMAIDDVVALLAILDLALGRRECSIVLRLHYEGRLICKNPGAFDGPPPSSPTLGAGPRRLAPGRGVLFPWCRSTRGRQMSSQYISDQKPHLAALGLALCKINHDLRNILASAQLISDHLSQVEDPTVQRPGAKADRLPRPRHRAVLEHHRIWPSARGGAAAAADGGGALGRGGRRFARPHRA